MNTKIFVEIIKSRIGMGDVVVHIELRPNEGKEKEIQDIIEVLADALIVWETAEDDAD